MTPVLIDNNLVGQSGRLWSVMSKLGWLDEFPIEFIRLVEVGLDVNSSDREIWNVMQERRMVLLTLDRNADGPHSLQRVMQESNTEDSMPIVTIRRGDLLENSEYLERCGIELIEVLLSIESKLGSGRIFIP